MDVLLIGGTRFLGIHIANAFLERGHAVTLFNSGAHASQAPPGVSQVHGRRETGLGRLDGRSFDAVIDTCGYLPGQVETTCRYFAGRTKHYTFVSSISALDMSGGEVTEATPLLRMPDGASRSEMLAQTYGPLKALCEAVVASTFRNRGLIVRPGLIAGPHDPTDRFTYWPMRVARGGTILAPVTPHLNVQFIDARDLAAWIVLQCENRNAGAYNVTGRPRTVTMGDVIETSMRVTGVRPGVRWASEAFLERHDVGEWIELPLWISQKSNLPGMTNVNVQRALATKLNVRPLAQTVRDTLAWARASRRTRLGAGLAPAREAELIAALPG